MTRPRSAPPTTAEEVGAVPPPAPLSPWITEPGMYDLDEVAYHADPVVGGSLSSSGARLLAATCPEWFDYDRRNPPGPKQEFDYGRAAHGVVLGVGAPIASLPFRDRRTNAYKAAVARARDNGETPLLERDADKVFEMAGRLAEHQVAGPLLRRRGVAEQAYVARDPDTGVMCRALLDWQPDVPAGARLQVVDYKTARSVHPRAFARAVADRGYHQQGPFYIDVLDWLGLVPPAGAEWVLVAQEKEPPYLVAVYTLSPRALTIGIRANAQARATYAACSAAGSWPGYPAGPVELDLPGWVDAGTDDLDPADVIGVAA